MKLFDVYPLMNIEPVKARGSWLWDKKGEKYLDLYGGHAVISVGHSHPHYVKAITGQLENIAFYSNSVINKLQEELAHKLGELSGYRHYSLFVCNSGAEANENALKMASFHNGRKKIITFKGSFHGRTSLAVAATYDKTIQAPVNSTHEILSLPLNDEEAFANAIDDSVCAVIIEGIQGVAGIKLPEASFLQLLRKKCHETGAILILDEVQSGYGRSGKFFAHQHAGIEPDIITTAKGMGNGFPVAGVLISGQFESRHGLLGTTFGGNHLACAAAIAVLDIIREERLIDEAGEKGKMWMTELRELSGIKEVRGLGLMIGLEFDHDIKPLRHSLSYGHHVLTGTASDKNTIRLLPALNISHEDMNLFTGAIKNALETQHKTLVV